MNEGVSFPSLEAKCGPASQDVLNALQNLQSAGLIESDGARLRLTRRGRLLYDTVAVEII